MHILVKCTPDTFLCWRVWCYFSSLSQMGLISITAQSSTRRRWSTSSSAPCPAGERHFGSCPWNRHPPEGWRRVRTTPWCDLEAVWAKMILTPRWNGSTIKRFTERRDITSRKQIHHETGVKMWAHGRKQAEPRVLQLVQSCGSTVGGNDWESGMGWSVSSTWLPAPSLEQQLFILTVSLMCDWSPHCDKNGTKCPPHTHILTHMLLH